MPNDLERARLLTQLFETFSKVPTDLQVAAYLDALEDIPTQLLRHACENVIRTAQFLPRPADVLSAAERLRRAAIEKHPYEGCEDCGGTGWSPQPDVDGRKWVHPCPCRADWLASLKSRGIPLCCLQLSAEGTARGTDD